jgi:hypothetical protein
VCERNFVRSNGDFGSVISCLSTRGLNVCNHTAEHKQHEQQQQWQQGSDMFNSIGVSDPAMQKLSSPQALHECFSTCPRASFLTGPSRMLFFTGWALNVAAVAAAAACSNDGSSCDLRACALLSERNLKGLGSVRRGLSTLGTPSCPELLSTRVL